MDTVVGEIVLSHTEIAWYIKTEGDKYSQQTWYFVSPMISKILNSIAHIYYLKWERFLPILWSLCILCKKSQIKIKIMKYLTSLWAECEQEQNV
jgi:hypothetical protein